MTEEQKNTILENLDRDVLIALNPFSMELAVYFIKEDVTILESFDYYDDWVYIKHPTKQDEYIQLHLDYDEFASLNVYHGNENLEQDYRDAISWQSDGVVRAVNIFIVHTDMEFRSVQKSFPDFEFIPNTRKLRIKI